MINAIGIALQGLGLASRQIEESAAKIANPQQEGVDLATELVNIKVAETSYKASLITLKVTDKLSDELLHTFDERV